MATAEFRTKAEPGTDGDPGAVWRYGSDESLPRITIHYAQSLDGRLATRTGHSQWLSGAESLHFSHCLRSQHDAVMVGIGTVLADDPKLTVRLTEGPSPQPIVVDSNLRIPSTAALLRSGGPAPFIATTRSADAGRLRELRQAGVECMVVDQDGDNRVDLPILAAILRERGVGTLLVEGGARIITALIRLHLADRIVISISPTIVGSGIDAIGNLGVDVLDQAIHFRRTMVNTLGPDILFEGEPAWS